MLHLLRFEWRSLCVRLAVFGVALSLAPLARAQSLETLEVKKASAAGRPEWGFGFTGIVETAVGLNRDRQMIGSLLFVSPQLKFREIYRLALNAGFNVYYLDRAANPWDFTDWSLQLSDLRIFKEERTGLNLSANARYYIPLSVDSRNADSRGALRGLTRLSLPVWKLDFGLNLMGFYRFAKYTTADPNRWQDADKMLSNGRVSFGEGLEAAFTPIERLTASLGWTFYQHQDYHQDEPYDDSGSSFISDEPRHNDVWEHTWVANAEVAVNVWKPFYVALGYNAAMPVLQESRRGVHYNPFDPQAAQLYLDLSVIY